MRFDYKNISIGFLIGVICTIITVALIGDVEIETDFQFGDKATNKDISIIIEKEVNQDGEEIITINATGRGEVTMTDIEAELERLYSEKKIDVTSEGIEVNITLDEEIDFEQ
jgi:hypothetical protein